MMTIKQFNIAGDFKGNFRKNFKKLELIKKIQSRDYFLKRVAKDFINKIDENRKNI